MKVAITNIGTIISGDWRDPFVAGDSLLMEDGLLSKVGTVSSADLDGCDLVVDANGVTACPGFIDSHVHLAFGDYSPRLTALGFLENYLHGGTTTSISASEVHVPGRPNDVEGVKALAITAKKCWDNLRPGGMRVHAGSVLLEPGLEEADFVELAAKGIWLAKAGFGSINTPFDYVPMVKAAQKAGLIVNVHTGGASMSLANSIHGKHLVAMQPDVAFHVNGGPIAMPEGDLERVVHETKTALQICQAGNIRTSLHCLELAVKNDVFDRFLIATDTPTGTGVMPQGMIKTITEMSCLTRHAPETMIAAATGNVAKVYRLNSGFLRPGKDADVLLIDAPLGGSQPDALSAIKYGDVTAGVGCFTSGHPRYIGRSRCTPPAMRYPSIVKNTLPRTFNPPGLV
jgi:enamidase